jgi:hypothetical protein
MYKPKARHEDVVVQEVFEELVIYDRQRNQVHSLNPTAARVWQQCDGQTSPAQLAARLQTDLETPQAEELVWLTLDRLEKAHLLDQKAVRPRVKISRRQALRALGVSVALLPVIASIPAPAAAQSYTCAGTIRVFDPFDFPDCSGDWDALCQGGAACNNPAAFGLDCGDSDVNPGSDLKLTCCCPS